jgi:hypothetical protein
MALTGSEFSQKHGGVTLQAHRFWKASGKRWALGGLGVVVVGGCIMGHLYVYHDMHTQDHLCIIPM